MWSLSIALPLCTSTLFLFCFVGSGSPISFRAHWRSFTSYANIVAHHSISAMSTHFARPTSDRLVLSEIEVRNTWTSADFCLVLLKSSVFSFTLLADVCQDGQALKIMIMSWSICISTQAHGPILICFARCMPLSSHRNWGKESR